MVRCGSLLRVVLASPIDRLPLPLSIIVGVEDNDGAFDLLVLDRERDWKIHHRTSVGLCLEKER